MSDSIARVVTSNSKAGGLLEFVKDLWRVKPLPPEAAELAAVAAKFADINGLRNMVVHYRSFVSITGERISTDAGRKKPFNNARKHRVTPQLLQEVTEDCYKVGAHFTSVLKDPMLPLWQRAENETALSREWRYLPNQNRLDEFLKCPLEG